MKIKKIQFLCKVSFLFLTVAFCASSTDGITSLSSYADALDGQEVDGLSSYADALNEQRSMA